MYVGKTVKIIEKRMKEHIRDSRKIRTEKRPLYRAMRKYGIEHFQIELIEECDCEILAKRERYWIDYYDTYNNGYNATKGGDGALLYDADKIVQMYNSGMLVIEIAKELGCDPAIVTKYLRRAGVDTHSNRTEWEKQLYISLIMLDKETNEIVHIFESCIDAGRWLVGNNYSHGSAEVAGKIASRAAHGKRPQAYGFLWKVNNNK